MNLLNVLLLATVQGLCELLPVSSSAHVILTERLLGLDPTAPAMTLLLVMLHTGTMLAVIVYFWRSWRATYFASAAQFGHHGWRVAAATLATGVVGLRLYVERENTRAQSTYSALGMVDAGYQMFEREFPPR